MNMRVTRPWGRGIALAGSVLLAAFASSLGLAVAVPVLEPGTVTALQSLAVEEKVAHDTYGVFAGVYDLPLFDNIALSESRHQATVAALLAKHGIADPTAGDPVGVFDDPTVQARYDAQLTQGRTSLAAALQVGVAVEQGEIRTLTGILAPTVPRDVTQVATNLLDGDRNHLTAFQSAADASAAQPPTAPVQRVQSAEVRAQVSGRHRVGDTLLLAARPVKTDAGVTIRWRVIKETRSYCEVHTRDGRTTVTLLKPGTCRVEGIAPAPSPEFIGFRVERAYRAVT
jgi:hypothetical protein